MSGIAIRPPPNSKDGSSSSSNNSTAAPPPPPAQSQTVLCRNILIHGYCKYADKGCVFRHDTQPTTPQPTPSSPATKNNNVKKKLNADSPSFTPSFIPQQSSAPSTPGPGPKLPTSSSSASSKPKEPVFNPENVFNPRSTTQFVPMNAAQMMDPISQSAGSMIHDFQDMSMSDPTTQIHQPPPPPPPPAPQMNPGPGIHPPPPPPPNVQAAHAHAPPPPPPPPPAHTPGLHDMSFQPQHHHHPHPHHHQQPPSAFPLNYHLYAPRLDRSRLSLDPHQRLPEDLFLTNSVREELQRKNETILQHFPAPHLPEYVHVYHSLVPLDMRPDVRAGSIFGYPSWTYKATNGNDGVTYCLRRIEGFKLTNEKAMSIIKKWNSINNPNVVKFHTAFTTRAFGDNSLICVYDFHPLATTLFDVQFNHQSMGFYSHRQPYSSDMLWTYVSQILSGLKSIHDQKLAARSIDLTKIIQSGQGRIRLNCVGALDIMNFEELTPVDYAERIKQLQHQDLVSFAKVILNLACNSATAENNIEQSLQFVGTQLDPELGECLSLVLLPANDESAVPTVTELISRYAAKFLDTMNGALSSTDRIENELSKELENGRLVRLLCKFGFINERPEYENDVAWSESGERYIIKLFRDYVFHQVDEYGNAIVDLGHVLSCLNKLDAGIDESIMLMSRDEQNCLIVSYKELKACIESAFRTLNRK